MSSVNDIFEEKESPSMTLVSKIHLNGFGPIQFVNFSINYRLGPGLGPRGLEVWVLKGKSIKISIELYHQFSLLGSES